MFDMTIAEMFDQLKWYITDPNMGFVRYALIVAPLIALCSALVGVTLVLKRFSFIGQGLSNVAFGTIAIATVANIVNDRIILAHFTRTTQDGVQDVIVYLPLQFLTVLAVTIITSILLLRMGQNSKINGDAAIAMISAGSMAVGYLLLNKFPSSSNLTADICSTMFGSTSILTLKPVDVWTCVILSVVVTAIFVFFYHQIFATTFDGDFAIATGIKAKVYNLILAIVIAVIIVLAINLVGTLLISALVIFPALSAMRVFKTFLSVTVCSVVISVVCAVLGILVAILDGTPVGSTIVTVNIACFGIFWLWGVIAGRKTA